MTTRVGATAEAGGLRSAASGSGDRAGFKLGTPGPTACSTPYSPGGSATFQTKAEAHSALAKIRVEIDAGTWLSPSAQAAAAAVEEQGPLTFGGYAQSWLAQRPLASRTRDSTARCSTST